MALTLSKKQVGLVWGLRRKGGIKKPTGIHESNIYILSETGAVSLFLQLFYIF